MSTVAPAADQTTDLLQKLSLDSQTKSADVPDAANKPSAAQFGSVVKADGANMPAHPNDRSTTPVMQEYMDTNLCYPVNGYTPYYYAGYDGHVNEWEEYARYLSSEGVDMSQHGVYGDVFHPGYGYAYGAYPPGSPVPTMGHDGQLYAPQPFQYSGAYYQASTPVASQAPVKPPPSQPDVSTSVSADQPTIPVETKSIPNGVAKTNGTNVTLPVKPAPKSSLTSNGTTHGKGGQTGGVHSGYQDPRYGYDGIRSPIPWMDGPIFPDAHHAPPATSNISTTTSYNPNLSNRNQNVRPLPHHMGLHPPSSGMAPGGGYVNMMYSNSRMYGQCGTAYRTGQGFNPNGFDARSNGRGWMPLDGKFNNKVRGRGNGFYGYGNENMEGLNELNRGPRSGRFKNNPKNLGPNVVLAVKGQSLPSFSPSDNSSLLPDRTQYNQEGFPVDYSDAKFFVIKSYSEDDVHKSVKYNVWASTPNGNKKLDDNFREAQEKKSCPIFLFFSVNTSGQFVGVAEMVGPVDFNKTVEYWQQDKWNGCFSVKWHIVKDVPNSILKHIILENNENKPVTNSRDTQEIKLEQGIQMLKLFKEHISKTSIFDDFSFYEGRQKAMQEKRTRQQFQKQVWDGKIALSAEDKEKNAQNTAAPQTPLEATLTKLNQNGESKQLQENGVASGDALKVMKLCEKRILVKAVANGIPNGGMNGVANGIIADIATKG